MTMTFLECCETVRDKGLHMIRPCEKLPGQYEICQAFDGGKSWIWLDAVTANVVCQVYEALSPDKREKFRRLPAGVILDLCWKVANGL